MQKIKISIEIEVNGVKSSFTIEPTIENTPVKPVKPIHLEACASPNVGDHKTETKPHEATTEVTEEKEEGWHLSKDLTQDEVMALPDDLRRDRKVIFNRERQRRWKAKQKPPVISQEEADEIVAKEIGKKFNPFEKTEAESRLSDGLQ